MTTYKVTATILAPLAWILVYTLFLNDTMSLMTAVIVGGIVTLVSVVAAVVLMQR